MTLLNRFREGTISWDDIIHLLSRSLSARSVTLYEVGLITILTVWLLNQVGSLIRLTPTIGIYGLDVFLFYMIRFVLFGLIWVILWFVEHKLFRRLAIHRLQRLRSYQGNVGWLDWVLLLFCIVSVAVASGTNVLRIDNVYFLAFIGGFAALQSIIVGCEYDNDQETATDSDEPEQETSERQETIPVDSDLESSNSGQMS